ncbi:MAG: Npt1/Npt2 family nucleotide transporter [Rickettsiaceae bacterium]
MFNYSFSDLRKVVWPIESHEIKKFLPMALMMLCILMNYSMLRSMKDGYIISIGTELISFIKTYVVFPAAIAVMIIYARLCNKFTQQAVFYIIVLTFVSYFAAFALVIENFYDTLHLSRDTIDRLSLAYPNIKWFIRIAGNWGYVSFYTMSELWGVVVTTLLFWQFANKITTTQEAKRFYSMFGVIGNVGLIITGFAIMNVLKVNIDMDSVGGSSGSSQDFSKLFFIIIANGLIVCAIYRWMNLYVLTDPKLYNPSDQDHAKPKKKSKISFSESMKIIFTSKYLGLIAGLVIFYGFSINLVEGVWKSKVGALYQSKDQIALYMANFQTMQGITSIIFMIIGANILRKVKWGTAAILTPLMILITGTTFFLMDIFDNTVSPYMVAIFSATPLVMAVNLGALQNILSKATKYSLFDSTKEMSYIPLDNELQTKGKAAVDVIGGRLGKMSGAIFQSTFFILFPSYGFTDAAPVFAAIFVIVMLLWILNVRALNTKYQSALEENHKQVERDQG